MCSNEASVEPPEPWRSFLREVDAVLKGHVELRCLGGFVVAQHYGLGRETSDIDFVDAIGDSHADDLDQLGGMRSELHRRYRVYLQRVAIATPPCDYVHRLIPMWPNAPWTRLKLVALDATDLALSKLERNAERDRDDFLRLVRAGLINLEVFKQRYFEEVRPYMMGNIHWHDKTLDLWLKMSADWSGLANRSD